MQRAPLRPAHISGFHAASHYVNFFSDPIKAVRNIQAQHGSFVVIHLPLPVRKFPHTAVMVAKPELNETILNHPEIWRTVNIAAAGRRNHASKRLSRGIVRMTGKRHAHYRKLILPPLRRSSIDEMGDDLIRIARAEIDTWPVAQPFDLWRRIRHLVQIYAISLLFGDDRARGFPIAELISEGARQSWSLGVNVLRLDLPGTPFHRMLRNSERLEEKILEWADIKKSDEKCGRDLLSIIVNNPDENANPPDDATIVGHVPTLFGATYETCQTTLIWTLILISQHPDVANSLIDELQAEPGDAPSSLSTINKLPLLDAVIKESMRLMPPVPMQFRVAQQDTFLGTQELPKNSRALMSAFLTNRNPDIYHNADQFIPDRWFAIKPTQFEYSAFSAGPRFCPGFYFGFAMVKVTLVSLLSRFYLSAVEGSRVDYKVRIAMMPGSAVNMVLGSHESARPLHRLRGSINDLMEIH